MVLYAEDGISIIGTFKMTDGGGFSNMAASSGTTEAMSRPKWSDWKRVWKVLKKDSITGKRINGRINERQVKIWSGSERWRHMIEYATDKEIFEGNLKDSINEYYT